MENTDVRYWWIFFLIGLLMVVGGIIELCFPVTTYVSIGIFLGTLAFLLGISHLAFVAANDRRVPGWKLHLWLGLFDGAVGFFLFFFPGAAMAVLPLLIGAWFFVRGVSMIIYGVRWRHREAPWGWLVAGGVCLFLLGLFMAVQLFYAYIAIIVWTAAALIVTGALNVLMAVRFLKEWKW